MKNTTTTTTATMNMNLFAKLDTSIKHGRNANYEQAAAYAAIIDAEPADTVKLRKKYGENVVTKADAVKAIYAANDECIPSKAQLSYMLYVGRVVNVDATIFDGLAFRAAATLAASSLRKDTAKDTAAAIREWLSVHTAARTMNDIKSALNETGTPSNMKEQSNDVHNCEHKDNEAAALATGTVTAARECLQAFFKAELAIAKESKDTARIKSVEAAWNAAMILGVPEYAESVEKVDAVASAIENTVKMRKRHDAAKKAAATRKAKKEALKDAEK